MFSKTQQKKALASLRQHAQNLRRLPPGQQLSPWPQAEDLVYAANPVYLEISQGGASPMRGWGALIFLFGVVAMTFGAFVGSEILFPDAPSVDERGLVSSARCC